MTTEKPKLKQQDVDGLREVTRPPPLQGLRIDGYFGPGLLRPKIGPLTRRSGEPQFCGSMVFRVWSCEPHDSKYLDEKTGKPRISLRFSGEFLGITYEGKRIHAAEGYIPRALERGTKARVDRGETVAFAGDLWCEPTEDPDDVIGFVYRLYDRRPRGEADPLMQLAVEAGLVPKPEPERRAISGREEVDPETGEVIEPGAQQEAAE